MRAEKRTGLITYVTAGDPDLSRSGDILCGLDRAGADVLEVGIPFSEPLADGPVIQRATERALAAGATASGVLDLVAKVRATVQAPRLDYIVNFPTAGTWYAWVRGLGSDGANNSAHIGLDGAISPNGRRMGNGNGRPAAETWGDNAWKWITDSTALPIRIEVPKPMASIPSCLSWRHISSGVLPVSATSKITMFVTTLSTSIEMPEILERPSARVRAFS